MTPQRQQILDMLAEDETVQFLEGEDFDEAIIGLGQVFTNPRAVVYDREKVIEVLIAQGLDDDDAEEYFAFNIEGAYTGETTPIFTVPWRRGSCGH